MKKLLLKRLAVYVVTAMMFTQIATAQIIYTDVNPDHIVNCTGSPCSASYSLDLNNDGINDFTLSKGFNAMGGCVVTYYRTLSVTALNSNGITRSSANTYPSQLFSNEIISSVSNIISGGVLRSTHQTYNCMTGNWGTITSSGNWVGSGYAGLKLIKNGQTFFGWVELSVSIPSASSASSCTIKGYAYNSIPNLPIHPGEKSCLAPTVTLSKSGPLSFCNGDSVTFTANGTGYQYQWKKNGTEIPGANSKTYVAKTAGIYKCKVTNSCGYKASDTKTVIISCRLFNDLFTEQFANHYELNIAPNPFSQSTTISFSLEQTENVSLKVFDLNGRLVKTLIRNAFEEGEHQLIWDVNGELTGIYILNIQTASYSENRKLIITR